MRDLASFPTQVVWREVIAKRASAALRPKYKQDYGIKQSTPINAEMVRRDFGAFR